MRATAWMGAVLTAAAMPALAAQVTIPPGASIALAEGHFDFGCSNVTVQGALSAGSALVVRTGNVTIASGGTLDAGSAWLILGGDWTNAGTFVRGTSKVSLRDECASGPAHIVGNNAF